MQPSSVPRTRATPRESKMTHLSMQVLPNRSLSFVMCAKRKMTNLQRCLKNLRVAFFCTFVLSSQSGRGGLKCVCPKLLHPSWCRFVVVTKIYLEDLNGARTHNRVTWHQQFKKLKTHSKSRSQGQCSAQKLTLQCLKCHTILTVKQWKLECHFDHLKKLDVFGFVSWSCWTEGWLGQISTEEQACDNKPSLCNQEMIQIWWAFTINNMKNFCSTWTLGWKRNNAKHFRDFSGEFLMHDWDLIRHASIKESPCQHCVPCPVAMVMSIRLLVDCAMFISLHFCESPGTRDQKFNATLTNMGSSVTTGALSTFLGTIPPGFGERESSQWDTC